MTVQVRAYKRENDTLKRNILEENDRIQVLQEQLDKMAGVQSERNQLQGLYDTLKRQYESEKQEITSLQQQLTTIQLQQLRKENRVLRQQATPTNDAAALKQQLEQVVRSRDDFRAQVLM